MMTCKICRHRRRKDIDEALVSGVSLRDIAGQFRLPKTALHRHQEKHLQASLAKAKQAEQITDATSLLDRVKIIIKKCEKISDKAARAQQWAPAISALGQVRGCMELLAKLRGELKDGASVQVNVTPPPARPLTEWTDEELRARREALLKVIDGDKKPPSWPRLPEGGQGPN